MKKFLYGMMAATMIFATSCENELELGAAGEESVVSFTISTPDMGSREYSDGTTATQLQYAVYDAAGNELTDLTVTEDDNVEIKGSATVNLKFTTGNTYSVIFWAAAPDAPYTVDFAETLANAKMTVDYTGAKSNDEKRDAFYKYHTFTVSGAQTETIELKRPFAQLNIGTNDYEASDEAGYVPTMSSVKVTKIYNSLNFKTGIASGEKEVTFGVADIDKDETFPVTGGYEYIAMNYILVNEQDKELVDVEFTYTDGTNAKTRKVGSVPVQRNHRTNIYGQLLTSDVDINIEIKPGFDGEENVDIWDGVTIKEPAFDATTKTYEINYASELAYIAQLVNGTLDTDNVSRAAVAANNLKGCTVKLMTSINLYNHEWTPIGMGSKHFQGTFDGNHKSISGLKITKRNDDRAALFGTVSGTVEFRNLTIKGASIVCPDFNGDFYGSALIGTAYGVVTIKNVDVVDSYISGNNKVGALLAHDGVMNTLTVSGCDVSGTTFEALNTADGGSVGGLVGYFQTGGEHHISNISVKGCIFNVVNSTNTGKRANGLLFGGIDSKAGQKLHIEYYEIEGNDWNEKFYVDGVEVTDNKFVSPYGGLIGGERDDNAQGEVYINGNLTVFNATDLQAAINAAKGETSIYLGCDINGNVTVVQKQGVKITIEGGNNKLTGAIKVHSNSNHYADAALTIKNVKFESSKEGINFIEALENGSERYSTNITVEGCTFTATDAAVNTAVGVQIKASKNAKVLGCTATGLHSLLQAQSCDEEVLVKDCTINGKNGIAFKQVKEAVVENTTITATGYGIRFDGNTDNYSIYAKDITVTAVQPFIVRRMTGANNTITLEGTNNLTTEEEFEIVITNGEDDAEYVKPTGTYTLTGADKFTIFPVPAVAKVGDTEYSSIDEAIANWKNNTTLTLLKDVTLKDVITLKSTEHHILNLGTYTMTAAKGKDAISITAEGRSSASYALDIKADATNPGGITATSKAVVKTTGKSGVKDRPIIRFYNGVFNASNIISHSGSNGTNSPQFNFYNGVYNGNISTNRAICIFEGGTFNGRFYMSVDSSSYARIGGGKFKYMDNLYGSALNADKFTIGSAKGVFDRGVYVDNEGYIVVGGPVITEFGDKFAAKATNASRAGSYLPYSSAAEHGLYYTNAEMAIAKHGEANVVLK